MTMKGEQKITRVLAAESQLIKIENWQKIIFVGDTHGDLAISQRIIKEYLKEENIIVFLGDYVDRGPYSKENLDFLLEKKLAHPQKLYLLQGNHEGYPYFKFHPADFWESLEKEEFKNYQGVLSKLPLVFATKELIALHGALPDLKNLQLIPGDQVLVRYGLKS